FVANQEDFDLLPAGAGYSDDLIRIECSRGGRRASRTVGAAKGDGHVVLPGHPVGRAQPLPAGGVRRRLQCRADRPSGSPVSAAELNRVIEEARSLPAEAPAGQPMQELSAE